MWNEIIGWVESWAERFYPGWRRWIFIAFVVCFVYLSLSGVFFFLFIRRGLFGFPLLLHVCAGGVFALCLTLTVFWRARFYAQGSDESTGQKFLFWIFAAAGFILIATSLGSMLSFLSLPFQAGLMGWHRFSAFLSLGAAVLFVYNSLKREQ